MSFERIRELKQFWKDNSRHIANTVEMETDHQMFLRPPRWGKSLFVNMLACYLDTKAAYKFDSFFGDTEIVTKGYELKHRNRYHVIHFDLSVDIGNCDSEDITARLYETIRISVFWFCSKYGLRFDDSLSTLGTLQSAIWQVEVEKGGKVFVLIDEYDRFANKLMFEKPDEYNKVVAGRSGEALSSSGRSFFECLKKFPNIRSFTVGLSPLALADASSANFIDDITDVEAVGDLLGLTEGDIRAALHKIFGLEAAIDPVVVLVKRFYNGFHFTDTNTTSPLYHTQLCLFFFRKLCRDRAFWDKVVSGAVTVEDMTDSNTRIGENVINLLLRQRETALITCQLNAGESVFAKAVTTFTLREMLSENAPRDLVVSFMRWHGLLTRSSTGQPGMHNIPNEVVGTPRGLLTAVERAMSELNFNVRSIINAPSAEQVWDMHEAIFKTMSTRLDNTISEAAIVGYAEVRLRVQGRHEGFNVFCEGSLNDWKRFDIMLVDPATKAILLLEYKRLRPGCAGIDQDLSRLGKKVKLIEADNVSNANSQLLQFDIMYSKQRYHKNAKTVREVLQMAWNQVSTRADEMLATPKYSNYKCTKGVVIQATTRDFSKNGEIFTSILGVWLGREMVARDLTAVRAI